MKTCKDCFYFKKIIPLSIEGYDAMTCGFEPLKYGTAPCEKFVTRGYRRRKK